MITTTSNMIQMVIDHSLKFNNNGNNNGGSSNSGTDPVLGYTDSTAAITMLMQLKMMELANSTIIPTLTTILTRVKKPVPVFAMKIQKMVQSDESDHLCPYCSHGNNLHDCYWNNICFKGEK